MIITQTFTMARWQIVVKMSKATKQNKDQNNNNKNKTTHTHTQKNTQKHNKNGRGKAGGKKANI